MRNIDGISLALLVFIFWNGNVLAQKPVYKCKGTTGKIQFTDSPCQGANEIEKKIYIQSNTVDFSGSREYQLRRENEQLRDQLVEQQRKSASNVSPPQRTEPHLQAERIDSIACERAKRDYEVTASSKFNSNTIVESKRSIMYGTCGMKEPDKNIVNVETNINNVVR